MKTYDLFIQSEKYSTKWEKYFDVYDSVFEKYRDKKITFVEVGVFNGGSLEIWKKYFHPESRIIGIDLNPECKKFEKNGIEIFIGDQSSKNFWDDFYKKVGKIDILLDDGGHTNIQQTITSVKSIPNINDNGVLLIEDTHSSYMNEFGNPSRYSFINFTKKLIDDVNFKYPNIGKFKISLNNYIYSIQYYESFVAFHINSKKASTNVLINNKPVHKDMVDDFRHQNLIKKKMLKNRWIKYFKFLYKYRFFKWCYDFISKSIIYFKYISDTIKCLKFFK
jgi:hypothetical protein